MTDKATMILKSSTDLICVDVPGAVSRVDDQHPPPPIHTHTYYTHRYHVAMAKPRVQTCWHTIRSFQLTKGASAS